VVGLPERVLINRDAWTRANAEYTGARARTAWAEDSITWGVWSVPESELQAIAPPGSRMFVAVVDD
jgi:hypothetical protein